MMRYLLQRGDSMLLIVGGSFQGKKQIARELAEEGLLTAEELDSARRDTPDRVDYPWLLETRIPLLRKAWARGRARYARELAEFLEAERSWLPDYALFLALRDRFDGKPLADWPDELRLRKQSALEKARAELKEACDFHAFLQLLFFRQWTAVKASHLCLPRQRRGVGPAGAVPAQGGHDPRRGGRGAPRRLLRQGPALGQPPV